MDEKRNLTEAISLINQHIYILYTSYCFIHVLVNPDLSTMCYRTHDILFDGQMRSADR